MLTIRKFRPEDLFAVIKLVSDTLNESYNPNLFLELSESWNAGLIVAEFNKKVVGFIGGVISAPREGRILILTVYENYRGRRIGSMLLQSFIQECIKKGIRRITLEVRVSNKKAINFYIKHGFFVVRIIHSYYKDGEDGYLMEKVI